MDRRRAGDRVAIDKSTLPSRMLAPDPSSTAMRDDYDGLDDLSAEERFGGRRRIRRAIVLAVVLGVALAVFGLLSLS